jgi:hypothetical protein
MRKIDSKHKRHEKGHNQDELDQMVIASPYGAVGSLNLCFRIRKSGHFILIVIF